MFCSLVTPIQNTHNFDVSNSENPQNIKFFKKEFFCKIQNLWYYILQLKMDITQYFYFWCKHEDFYGPSDSFFPPIYWFYKSGGILSVKKKFPIFFSWLIIFSKYPKYHIWPTGHTLNIWDSDNLKTLNSFLKNHIVIKYNFFDIISYIWKQILQK